MPALILPMRSTCSNTKATGVNVIHALKNNPKSTNKSTHTLMHSRRLIWRKSPKLFLISFNDPPVNNKCLVDAISICRRNQTTRKSKIKFFCFVLFCFVRFRFRGSYTKARRFVKDTHSTSRARCRRQKHYTPYVMRQNQRRVKREKITPNQDTTPVRCARVFT